MKRLQAKKHRFMIIDVAIGKHNDQQTKCEVLKN